MYFSPSTFLLCTRMLFKLLYESTTTQQSCAFSYLCNNICGFTEIMASAYIGPGQKVFYQPNTYVVTPVSTQKSNKLQIKDYIFKKATHIYTNIYKRQHWGEETSIWEVPVLNTNRSATFLLSEQHTEACPLRTGAPCHSRSTHILSSCLLTSSSFS